MKKKIVLKAVKYEEIHKIKYNYKANIQREYETLNILNEIKETKPLILYVTKEEFAMIVIAAYEYNIFHKPDKWDDDVDETYNKLNKKYIRTYKEQVKEINP